MSYRRRERNLFTTVGASTIVMVGVAIAAAVFGYQFNINCGGHLKRAADANSITLAKQELRTALDYLEKNKLTEGSSAIFFDTPDTDIGFWYQNLSETYRSLTELDNPSPTEESNVLLKLRETLLDHGEKGDSLTIPTNMTVYPHQALFFWGFALPLIVDAVLALALVFGD